MPQITSFEDTAPYFGFSQAEIEEIRIDKSTERSRKLSLLWKWRNKNGSDATYIAIVKVFLSMQEQNLAEIILQYTKTRFQYQHKSTDSCVYPERTSSYGNWDRKSAVDREQIKNRLFNENQDI